MRRITCRLGLASLLLLALLAPAHAEKQTSHFGVKPNFPRFTSFKQFSDHYRKVREITTKKSLDGQPLDMSWITPLFRERLCLVVTINDHCNGG
jgi:hypothetical protein